MSGHYDFSKYTVDMDLNSPASSDDIRKLEDYSGVKLPPDYIAFMLLFNGGEGGIGEEGYVRIWRIEEVVKNNIGYKIPEFYPGLIVFGTDGGGEAYAFDTREDVITIVNIPFIGDLDDALPCGKTFLEFLEIQYNG